MLFKEEYLKNKFLKIIIIIKYIHIYSFFNLFIADNRIFRHKNKIMKQESMIKENPINKLLIAKLISLKAAVKTTSSMGIYHGS